ncbi:myxochelin export MFS transporter MxcK [Archangium lansingense]|uniref:Myxochelin export MFS transporter MxcK n=1 Tax=Archangium lansingense TaxID=2995310 RepID=A0ABT4A086_9BACT|nr:myxochelin export MFS transporter MxcK [Archangium lansinium]MCY1074394.1 myxochelin export MFS transporter MxcK [Archangium lansinium]
MTVALSSRREHWVLLLLAAVQFTHMMDFMLVMPLGPEFMRLFGISAASFGVLVSAYTLASAGMGLLGGLWLDRFDRKRTLLVLYAGFLAATLLCGAADGYFGLLAARTVAGACAGLMSAVIQAIIGDLIPMERRGRAIGTVMASYGLSAVAGVPLGLGLATQWGWRSPFWVIGALSAGAWLGLLVLLPAVNRHLSPAREASSSAVPAPAWTPGLALGWVLTFSVVFSGFLLIPYLSPFMVGNLGLQLSDLSWIYLCGGAASLVSARGIGRLVDRYGPARILGALLVGTMVPHLVFTHLSASPLPVVAGVFVLFMGLTSGRAIPTMALVASRVPPALRGRYLAMNMAASDGASGLGAWVSGLLITVAPDGALVGFGFVGWIAVGVTGCALFTLWVFTRRAVALSPAPA